MKTTIPSDERVNIFIRINIDLSEIYLHLFRVIE